MVKINVCLWIDGSLLKRAKNNHIPLSKTFAEALENQLQGGLVWQK